MEEWIRAGLPLQLLRTGTTKGRRPLSALELALQSGSWALSYLLLCNGYDPNLEPSSPLNLALRARRWDLLDLLLEWGADPHRVSLSDLFETYRSELFERFLGLGVDVTSGHELASTLAYHASNKPVFGFARRHREQFAKVQVELNIALGHHASEGNEKGVQLCLWAGADPHAPAPSLQFPQWTDESDVEAGEPFLGFTAIEEACRKGDARILERLGPAPGRDDFEALFRVAANSAIVRILSRYVLPKDVGSVIRSQVGWVDLSHLGCTRSSDALACLFSVGARWTDSTPGQVNDVRRTLLRLPDYAFVELIKLLVGNGHCAPELLLALGRTPAMRARLTKAGFTHGPPAIDDGLGHRRPTRSREVLLKLGLKVPKRIPRRMASTVTIGKWHPAAREVRFDRRSLFEQVWSEPIERLATVWGLSGRGLAKACRRLKIPVPPRGFWARARTGCWPRRPKLPELASGEAEKIVIYVARDVNDGSPAAPSA